MGSDNTASGDDVNHLLRTMALCTFAILFKYIVTLFWSADLASHPAEDKMEHLIPTEEAQIAALKRKQRIFGNDIENIPIHLVIFWGTLQMIMYSLSQDNSKDTVKGLQGLVIIYTIGRYGHTLCYAFALQPFRTICFAIAQLSALTTGILMIYAAFQADFKF